MSSSKYIFTLDLRSVQSQISLPVTQGDTNRTLIISFSDGAKPYVLGEKATAMLSIVRPTGTSVQEYCKVDEGGACATYEFSEHTVAVAGLHKCQLVLYNAVGKQIASPKFSIDAAPKLVAGDDVVIPDEELNAIEEIYLAEARRVTAELSRVDAETQRENAEAQRAAAELLREEAETQRENAEAKRVSAEMSRENAETQRENAETARQNASKEAIDNLNAVKASIEQKRDNGEFDGKKGDPGYTPVKGEDYWTNADKEEITAEANALIADELAKKAQLKPEFAESIEWLEDNADKTKLYVVPDNSIYAYMHQEDYTVKLYTNALEKAEKADSTDVYGTNGYQYGIRLSSSGGERTPASTYITGFIPCTIANTLYFKNCQIKVAGGAEQTYQEIGCYDSNKQWVGTRAVDMAAQMNGKDYSVDGNYLTRYNCTDLNWGGKNPVAYVRITGNYIAEGSIISVDNPIEETVVEGGYQWADTMHDFVPGNYDEDIVYLNKLLLTHESRIADLEEDVAAQEEVIKEFETKIASGNVPDYWQTALNDGVEAINTALCTAGFNKSAFLFYTDAHWNVSSQMSPKLLKYLYEHTGMAKTFFGGDIVTNEGDDYDTMAYLWGWRNQLKGLPNHHSVVGNHDDGNSTNNRFSEKYVYGYLLAAEETADIVRGNGLYYYIDNPSEKTRYLFLDTAYKGAIADQQEFVKTALLGAADGWHIVVVSHIWYDTIYTTTPPSVGGINPNASIFLTMFDNYNQRVGEYTDCGGRVEFCIGGHTHRDYDGTSESGIPIILVETDSRDVRNGKSEAQYKYTAGTSTESSVNGIIADYDNSKVYIVRVGRGESREISY